MVKYITFKDYPNFRPNLTPKEIFEFGSFGGTYWRPIYSSITDKNYRNKHKKFKFLKHIDENLLTRDYDDYDKNLNKYKVKVGTTLEFWESKDWITNYDPYGWVQWYCNFYAGRRTNDDERQIKRWEQTAGPNSRFRLWLMHLIKKNKTTYNDFLISPKIRQTLQHWGYILTIKDYKHYLNN